MHDLHVARLSVVPVLWCAHETSVAVSRHCTEMSGLLCMCRAIHCKQFAMAELLVDAGADPMHKSKVDKGLSYDTSLKAVMTVVSSGKSDVTFVGPAFHTLHCYT